MSTIKSFDERNAEFLRVIKNATDHIRDPNMRARAENTALRAKLIEQFSEIEVLERTNERLRIEQTKTVRGGDVQQRVGNNTNAPRRESADSVQTIATFRDGSKIERHTRGRINNWWFSTGQNQYIRVRSQGDDPYGVYIPETRLAQLESAIIDASKRLDRDSQPLCAVAYKQVTGKTLFV